MLNQIIFGHKGWEKLRLYYIPTIKAFEGRVYNFELFDFKIFPYPQRSIESLDNDLDIDILNQSKKFRVIHDPNDPKYSIEDTQKKSLKSLEKLIDFITEHIEEIEVPVLFGFDEFSDWYLDSIMQNGKSVLVNLLTLNKKNPKIITILTIMDIFQLEKRHKEEIKEIMGLCKIMKVEPFNKQTEEIVECSGELRVRFPKTLHWQLTKSAKAEGVSLNQYIVYQLTKVMANEDRIDSRPYIDAMLEEEKPEG